MPPDVKAGMWWLQNRRPETWRDVRHIKHDVEKGGPLENFLNEIGGISFGPVDPDAEAPKGFAPGLPSEDGEEQEGDDAPKAFGPEGDG